MDINVLSKQIKLPPETSEKDKWSACLASKDEKVVQNALYCAQQCLQKNEGIPIFKELLSSDQDQIVQNTMHLLANSNSPLIFEEVKKTGFKRLIQVLDITPLPKKLYLLHFIARLLGAAPTDVVFSDQFITDGGLEAVIKMLSLGLNDQISNLSLKIFSDITAARQKTRDYSVFATKENFNAFSTILKNSKTQSPNTVKLVLTILANIVNEISNRDLFHQSDAIHPTIELLKSNPELQDVVVTLISNVISKAEIGKSLLNADGLPPIINVLDSTNERSVTSALSVIHNLVKDEENGERTVPILHQNKGFHKILKHARTDGSSHLKLQSVKTIKNLLTIESAQECVKEAGGIPVLLQIAKAEKNEETKIAALSALFNFTIYSEDMRTSLLESGLDDLTRILTSSTQSDESKKLVAKSMVNMALSGENEKFSEKTTLTGLIKVLNHEDDEIDEYSSMTLENLAINKTLNEAISQYGGVEASIDFLKKASAKSNPKAKERSAKLISKLAISSKNRKKLQNPEVAKILKDLEKDVDPTVLSAIKLAQNNVNVPLFEAEEKAPVNFSEFDQYQLESEEEASEDESEIHEPEKVEKAPEQRATKEEHEKRRKRHTHKMPKKPPPPVDSDPERLRLARLDVKRTKVAYELLTTESSYCHNLEIIIRKFQNPLLQLSRSKKPLISINDIRAIFGSAEIIHGYNSMLLDSLQSRISKWGNQQIVGDIFLYMGDCFKIYTDYINNFPHAQQTLQNVTRDNPKFKKWLEKTCAQDFCSGLSLLSFLIMPVQRMPRYSLLLRELNSSTPAGHPDEGNIKEAIQKIEYVNSYLNDKKRETEGQFKMIELISNFVESDAPILLHNNRTVDQSWDVSWSDGKHKMNGQFVILSDSIIYSKVMQKKGKIMKLIEFAHISISDETKGEKLVLLIDEHDKKKTKFQLEVIFPKPIFASKAKSVIEAKFKEAKANK